MSRPIKQQPNKKVHFPCGHSGTLPKLKSSNNCAKWVKDSGCRRGGSWICIICARLKAKESSLLYSRGRGPVAGLFGWAGVIIRTEICRAQKLGYKPARITLKKLIELRKNAIYCSDGCGQKLKWCTNGKFTNPHLHHNHETGEVYGFVTSQCNLAQGYVKKVGYNNPSSQASWLKFHFPEIVEIIKERL
jgi:hypothetical protein